MPISPLPVPPSRSDPENFPARGDAFLNALPGFATEANALQQDVNTKQAAASAAGQVATEQAELATTKAAAAAGSAGAANTSKNAAGESAASALASKSAAAKSATDAAASASAVDLEAIKAAIEAAKAAVKKSGDTMTGRLSMAGGASIQLSPTYGQEVIKVGGSIGGAFADWAGSRQPALQIDCSSSGGAYMGIRWTQWGVRHIAAIEGFAGGSDGGIAQIIYHLGGKANAWTFTEQGIDRGNGGYVWGSWNFDPGSKQASGNYVRSNTGNSVQLSWSGSTVYMQVDNVGQGDLWHTGNFDPGGKANAQAQCQHGTGVNEFGNVSMDDLSNARVLDLPAPWVVSGLRYSGFNGYTYLHLRGVWLRNQ